MLLALDTSAGTSVAVVDGGVVLAQVDEFGTRSHAEVVGVLVADALRASGADPRDLSAVGIGMGPGPFTGLRVGIAAARAFARALGIPVVSVVSPDGIAFEAAAPVLVVTDARRRESAWTLYGAPDADGLPSSIAGPALAASDAVDAAARDALGTALPSRIDATAIPAGPLGLVAQRRLQLGRVDGPTEPLYLRVPDATVPGPPKRVST